MIGYAVSYKPVLASYRLRVAIPAAHLGVPYAIGQTGSPSFFYKLGNPDIARQCRGGVVFDVVNDHFDKYPTVREMATLADALTCGSTSMAATVKKHTGRDAMVIDDPYENDEQPAACKGNGVLWFGHRANLPSLTHYADTLEGVSLLVCSDHSDPRIMPWSPAAELKWLDRCAVVLMTGTNPGASSNRAVKALRAGRFVVAPNDNHCAESWRQFRDYIWIGDVREGVKWALNNREAVCQKIRAGQLYIAETWSPQAIARQWRALFESTSGAATSASPVGLG